MADRKPNPAVSAMRKGLELMERKMFLQRQELRLLELTDEKAIIEENIVAAKEQISAIEAEIVNIGKPS